MSMLASGQRELLLRRRKQSHSLASQNGVGSSAISLDWAAATVPRLGAEKQLTDSTHIFHL